MNLCLFLQLMIISSCLVQLAFFVRNIKGEIREAEGSTSGPNIRKNKQKYFGPEGGGEPGISASEQACLKAGGDCKENLCKWGYEKQCKNKERYSEPKCKETSSYRHFRSIEERIDAFWDENDFGYINKVNKLQYLCKPKVDGDSSFACNSKMTFCRGRHIFMDFTWNGRSIFERAENKPFHSGQFGGSCEYIPGRFTHPDIFHGKLKSWADQIDSFQSLNFKPSLKENCDITVLFQNQPSLWIWTSARPHGRLGPFGDTWKAFTNTEVFSLWQEYNGKKVCFSDVVFSLLPRMAYGMYYSTPVVEGCSKSGIFHAFSKHVLKNLNLTQDRKSKKEPLRITLLSRSTQWRRIVNENELLASMKANPSIQVKVVDFNTDVQFLEQLKISHNTDIFIGIHGAGLAHTLFLPDWSLLFELYNTEDINCYKDLARLRGVSYMTWEDKSKLKDETDNPHPDYNYEKFRNYHFDVKEFERLLGIAVNEVNKNLKDEFSGN